MRLCQNIDPAKSPMTQILARIVKGMCTTWKELVLSQVSGTNNVLIVLIANTL